MKVINSLQNIILEVLTVIVALLRMVGNAVVLWLLGFGIRRNAFSVYILNLAGADFLYLCYQFINSLVSLFEVDFFLGVMDNSLLPVPFFAYLSGLSFLSAISTEHCMSVLWPICYPCHRPRKLSTIMCALLWALSLLLSMLQGYYCGFLVDNADDLTENEHEVWCPVLDLITVARVILLFVLLSGSSLALMSRLLCGSHRVLPTRLYVTILLTVLVFLLCGLPVGIHWFLIYWLENNFDSFLYVYKFVVPLSCVNSWANPIIYFFVGSFRQRWWKWQHTMRLVLQRALQDTPEVWRGEQICQTMTPDRNLHFKMW